MTTDARVYRSPRNDAELRTAVCAWLRDNDIDPKLVPADCKPHLTEYDTHRVLDIRLRERGTDSLPGCPNAHGFLLNEARTAFVEKQHTLPIHVPPPAIVREWLHYHCPTCQQ